MPTFRDDIKLGAYVPLMKTDDINDQAITTVKIRDRNVTSDKLSDGAIKSSKIADGNVTAEKLAESSVVTSKIADKSITNVKLGDGSVTTDKIASKSITEDKIADRNVDETNFQSQGYEILRKNLVKQDDGTYKNVLSNANIADKSVIDVKYDFDGLGNVIGLKDSYVISSGGKWNNVFINANHYSHIDKNVLGENALLRNVAIDEEITYLYQIPFASISFAKKNVELFLETDSTNCNFISSFKGNNFILHGNNHNITLPDDKKDLAFRALNKIYVDAVRFYSDDENIPLYLRTFYTSDIQRLEGIVDIKFTNCTFENTNIYIANFSYKLIFENCKFKNCIINFYSTEDAKDNSRYCDIVVKNCTFEFGKRNVNNNELIQPTIIGNAGKFVLDGCSFYNFNDTGYSTTDAIDVYGTNNVIITNCLFYYKQSPGGEGIINIKSHSRSSVAQSWAPDDLYAGNTIVSNNTFVIESDSNVHTSGVIWIRNMYRDDNTVHMYERGNIVISNNAMYVRTTKEDITRDESFIYIQTGIKNVVISDNVMMSNCKANMYLVSAACNKYNNTLPYIKDIVISNNIVSDYTNESSNCSIFEFNHKGDIEDDNLFEDIIMANNIVRTKNLNVQNIQFDLCSRFNFKMENNIWRNKDKIFYANKGDTANRPVLTNYSKGFEYYDTTLNKKILWNGSDWANLDGTSL